MIPKVQGEIPLRARRFIFHDSGERVMININTECSYNVVGQTYIPQMLPCTIGERATLNVNTVFSYN